MIFKAGGCGASFGANPVSDALRKAGALYRVGMPPRRNVGYAGGPPQSGKDLQQSKACGCQQSRAMAVVLDQPTTCVWGLSLARESSACQ